MNGKGSYPLDIRDKLRRFSEALGYPIEAIQANRLLPPLVKWINSAYAQGQQDAKGAAV